MCNWLKLFVAVSYNCVVGIIVGVAGVVGGVDGCWSWLIIVVVECWLFLACGLLCVAGCPSYEVVVRWPSCQ